MGEPVRILRVVIISALILLGVKTINLVTGYDAVASQAQDSHGPPATTGEVKHAEPATADPGKPGGAGGHDATPAPGATALPPDAEGPHEAAARPSDEGHADDERTDAGRDVSRAEVEVLQNLAARRQELDERARELDMRDKLLRASEQRVEERISELKSIEANIQSLLHQRDAAQEAEIMSLVKVYEGMKPKDAARIFNKLEMDILLPVTRHMKAPKAAAILAEMDPDAAKRLTVSLARHFASDKVQVPANAVPDGAPAIDSSPGSSGSASSAAAAPIAGG